ncbi:MAG: hypothetical protein GXY42_02425 [Desulfovibrionales bacterium]|nr:hypothetical protein [Desulfovibrionales bacterium]
MNLIEKVKIVEAIAPQAGAAITGDYVSLKKAGHVTVVVDIAQGYADPVAITIEQATKVDGTGSKPLAVDVPIYLVADAATSDAWVRQTDDVEFTTSATLKHKLVAFEIDASALDVAGGFDCVTVKTAASNALNLTQAYYVLSDLRYGVGASVIVD